MQWMENGFFDHLDKFANSLGYENFAIAIPLAMVPWQSPEDREHQKNILDLKQSWDINKIRSPFPPTINNTTEIKLPVGPDNFKY